MAAKKFTPISGVYRITCKINGKSYIGSSVDIRKRWNAHQRLLGLGQHHSIHLQRAWLLLGRDAFDMEILEECDAEGLLEHEQYWLGLLNTTSDLFGYNISQKAGAPMAGLKHRDSAKKKMSQSQTGRKHSDCPFLNGGPCSRGQGPPAARRADASAVPRSGRAFASLCRGVGRVGAGAPLVVIASLAMHMAAPCWVGRPLSVWLL